MFSVQKYKAAMESLYPKLPELYVRMLRAQYEARDRTVSTPQMAQAVGAASHGVVNLHYGLLARRICSELGESPKADKNGKIYWFEALSKFHQEGFLWEMNPNFAKALEELKIV